MPGLHKPFESRPFIPFGEGNIPIFFQHLLKIHAQRSFQRIQRMPNSEFICKAWTTDPERFTRNLIHQMPGQNSGYILNYSFSSCAKNSPSQTEISCFSSSFQVSVCMI